MNISNWMKGFAAIAGSALMGLIVTSSASAAVEQVPVEVEWVSAITIGENNPLQFGMLDLAIAASETVTINTDDSYSESTANTVVGGTQAAADLTITAAASTPITILVDNVAAANYYTLGTWLCSYDGLADQPCDVAYNLTSKAAASASLEIGATLTTGGSAVAGADDTTFDVTVTYQ
jgi:hypothetical protein